MILFCKIGWMENYCGQTANDQIQGGGSYVKKHGIGHEVCNFAPNPAAKIGRASCRERV